MSCACSIYQAFYGFLTSESAAARPARTPGMEAVEGLHTKYLRTFEPYEPSLNLVNPYEPFLSSSWGSATLCV